MRKRSDAISVWVAILSPVQFIKAFTRHLHMTVGPFSCTNSAVRQSWFLSLVSSVQMTTLQSVHVGVYHRGS